MSTPLITAISKLYKTKVDLLVFPTWVGSSSILKNYEFVNEIFEEEILKYDIRHDIVIVTWWGKKGQVYYDCKKLIQAKQPNYFNQHEIEHNMDLARELGWEGETPKQWVYVENMPIKKNSKKISGIHSGCFGGLWKKKKYPYFKDFVKKLIKLNYEIWNFGTNKEQLGIKESMPYVEIAGKSNLNDTINYIACCTNFISNDSGLMHIADALNIPLIALFGPTLITKNRPINENSNVLVNTMTCQPCQYTEDFNICQDNKCLQFKPEMIINYMKKLNWISD